MPENALPTQKKIYPYLDILRIVACYFVILNHSLSHYIYSANGSATWVMSFAPLYISKSAVPIFLMITGVLSLGKVDSYKKTCKKTLKTIAVLVLFSAFAIFYDTAVHHGFDISVFKDRFLSLEWIAHSASNSYWYLFMYIGILVMLPLLQRLSTKMEKKDFIYLFIFSFVYSTAVDIITHYTDFEKPSKNFNIPIFAVEIAIPFLGYFIHNFVNVKKKHIAICAAVYVLFIATDVALTYYDFSKDHADFLFYDGNAQLMSLVHTCCLFIIIKYLFENVKLSQKKMTVLRELGACTFGAYLFGDFIIKIFDGNVLSFLEKSITVIPSRIVFSVFAFSIAMLISFLIRRIPFVRKLI